jgi:outer membrane protein assembly factor BamD (BamD/ComL family)
MLTLLIVLLVVLGLGGGAFLYWKGLKRAAETDKPAERLLVRVGLSLMVVVGPIFLARLILVRGESAGGGMVGGFAIAFIVAGIAATVGILLGIVWAPEFGNLIARPFVNLFMGSSEGEAPKPLYSAAQARRNQGKFAEAITEIHAQLERFPDDAQGWMMLAEIQAKDLKQFDQAVATITTFISREGQSPQQIVAGLSRLADWHLELRHDFVAAREILERIVANYPDLPQSRAAYQRLTHLEEKQRYAGAHADHAMAIPAADPRLGLRKTRENPPAPVENFAGQVEELRRHLDRFPLDRETREQLALLYAHQLHQPDQCADQMEYLLALPDALPAEIARWLNLLADVYIKETQDAAAARQALERLIEALPDTTMSGQARQRLERLEVEIRHVQQTRTVKLDIGDQRLGLKMEAPWRRKRTSE